MTETKASISIVVPTYDRPSKLRRALKSCLAQSCQPHEVLVVDNGQNPETLEGVNEAQSKTNAFPIRHIHSEAFNLRKALSRGIQEASGEWIILLDDDDFLVPDRIKSDTKIINPTNESTVVIVQDFVRVDYGNELVWIHRMGHKSLGLQEALCLDSFPPPPAATWRSTAIKAHHSFDQPEGWMTDFELYSSILPHGTLLKSGHIGYVMDDTRVEGRLTTSVDKYMQMIDLHRERFEVTRELSEVDEASVDRRLDQQKAFFAAKNLGLSALFSSEMPYCRQYLKESLKGLASPLRVIASSWLSPLLPEIRGSRSYKLNALARSNPDLCNLIKASKI